jgi:tetratricopeptide (TPR) repeat protein
MAKDKHKAKKAQSTELLENPEVLADSLTQTEQFFEKNKRWLLYFGGVLVAVISGYFLLRTYISNQNESAQRDMFQAVYYFEADSLDRALNGDGNNYGFLDIIREYRWTESANLAHFYAGVSLLRQGEFISAIDHLEKFKAGDLVVQARAYSLIGDARMEMEEYQAAARMYEKAAAYKPNEQITPEYLKKAAVAYEMMQDYKSAYACYDVIVKKYVNSGLNQEARKHRARLEQLKAS